MSVKLTRHQSAVLAKVLTAAGSFSTAADLFEFAYGQKEIVVASSRLLVEDDDIHVVFNLPATEGAIFAAVTDGDARRVAEIVSSLALYSYDHRLDFGHTVPFANNDYMKFAGRVAVLLLNPEDSAALENVGRHIHVGSIEHRLHLVLFLDSREYDVKVQQGLVALLDHMERAGRDKVGFVSRGKRI